MVPGIYDLNPFSDLEAHALNKRHSITVLADNLSRQYFSLMSESLIKTKRTYGFEYEFLPDRRLSMQDMARVDHLLEALGGQPVLGERLFGNGLRVAFEPGGQIEYCSPPLFPDDPTSLDQLLEFISWLNERIRDKLNIDYIGTGYMPGRAGGPLCLRSPRYLNLHRRLATSGTRGHDMMKATAAIHLHAAICSMHELPMLFQRMCAVSRQDLFQMSDVRRDIWNNTDPTRCGIPPCCLETFSSPEELICEWVRFALQVVVLGEEVPFKAASDRSFDAFLYLLTTVFTDIRFNMKGPTLELRTLDSVPVDQFNSRWRAFINAFEMEDE